MNSLLFLAFSYGKNAQRGLGVRDYGTEGILIGDKVPLEFVKAMFTNFLNIPKLSLWSQQHCPEAKVISLEAQMLLEETLSFRKKYGIQSSVQGTISLWEDLLTKKAVILSKKIQNR